MRLEQGRFGGPEIGFRGFSEQYFSTPTPDRPRENPEKPHSPEPKKSLFINGYNGNFAQDMIFDETKIGKALHIAHLDGIVSVIQMPQSR